MAIKNILVHVDPSDQSVTTVRAAASVARKFDARLNGFFVIPDVTVAAAVPSGAIMSAQIVEDMQKHAERHAAKAEELFRDVAGELAVAGHWTCADGLGIGAREAAARVAYYADMVVAGADGQDDEGGYRSVFPQDLVVDSGRPLLFVPPEAPTDMAASNIVIGWAERREAARAVFDSLPFLAAAETVTVVSIVPKDSDGSTGASKIAGVLLDQAIQASVETMVAGEGQNTSETLFDYVRQSGADFLVAGGYSRSRLREGLFGGVTKSIFDAAPVPTLLSH